MICGVVRDYGSYVLWVYGDLVEGGREWSSGVARMSLIGGAYNTRTRIIIACSRVARTLYWGRG